MESLDPTNSVTTEEERAYSSLCRKLKGTTKYDRIVTCGRGGLSVAQRVAYLLNIPVHVVARKGELRNLKPSELFVDDIACTGATIGLIPRNVDTAVLIQRKSSQYKANYFGFVFDGEDYIKFSWEK